MDKNQIQYEHLMTMGANKRGAGLLLNRKRNWEHEPRLLEDEKPEEPQSNV